MRQGEFLPPILSSSVCGAKGVLHSFIVLNAFEEDGWVRMIYDPLPGKASGKQKQRLHDVIVHLNRDQRTPIIRFRRNGQGNGIIWDIADSRPVRRHRH